MACELSSNWKRLQDAIKADSTKPPQSTRKRKRNGHHLGTKESIKITGGPSTSDPIKEVDLRKRRNMGVSQSSKIDNNNHLGVSPSLSLWFGNREVSSEDLAEAYDLGIKDTAIADVEDKINSGVAENLQLGKYVAIDCEMVGIGPGGHGSALARVSLVDYHGSLVYDSYVRPRERVTDWRTSISGISSKNMRFARPFEEVQKQISDLLQGRILIGHDVKHDLNALELSHPASRIRDSSSFSEFRQYATGRKPSLRILTQEILGIEIQGSSHSSIVDARATMLLFRRHKTGFDLEYANRFPNSTPHATAFSKASKSTKKRGKRNF